MTKTKNSARSPKRLVKSTSLSFQGEFEMFEKIGNNWLKGLFFISLVIQNAANAALIDFTGGTAYVTGSGSLVTTAGYDLTQADYYIENGFKLDFVGGSDSIGDYYGKVDPMVKTKVAGI